MTRPPFKPLRRALRPPHPRPEAAATDLDRDMMQRALQLAQRAAEQGEVPVGAVVYETATGRILSEAANTREHDRTPHGHAEFLAIQHACKAINDWRLNHCSLAVTLEPCPMCAGLIVNARLGRVIYAADDPKAGAARSLYTLLTDPRLNHRTTLIHGLYASQAATHLKDFFKAKRTNR